MAALDVPPASADATEHADWLELVAVTAPDSNVSRQDLISALGRTGSVDAVRDSEELDDKPIDNAVEREDEELDHVVDAAFEQLAMRKDYIGSSYPFAVDGALLEADGHAVASPYTFLTALTHFGPLASNEPETGASLFERVSASVLVQYLGGRATARSYLFGFPRRDTPKSFRDALDDLCTEMGEGRGCNVKRPKVSDMKDAGLDVVAWVPFADGRPNQLSVFGQCAAGKDWYPKLNELNPVDFCNRWLKESPAMFPFGAFFVPLQLGDDHWSQACVGERRLLFDRLRIGRLLVEIDNDLSAQCAVWTASAIG